MNARLPGIANSVSRTTGHVETHFSGADAVRDVVLGMSDGLTVPFALAAGVSGAIASTHLVVAAGLAEVAAGSMAMGLGGYLAARSEAEHYAREQAREEREVVEKPEAEAGEVSSILQAYGLTAEESAPVVQALQSRPRALVDFMMRFELGLQRPEPRRALTSAVTIGGSYVTGGLVPLLPYMLLPSVHTALLVSVGVTLAALFLFGYVKGRFTGVPSLRSAMQTVIIGGIAAAAAFGLARLVA
jgi:vacuolar iron transporter family protein